MPTTRRRLLAGAAATAAAIAAPAIVRAQSGPLKVGVLLPRSGFEAGIGQDCQRGVDIAPAILKSHGPAGTDDHRTATPNRTSRRARARAEKLISDGAQLLVGAFDSGQIAGDRSGRRAEGHSVRHQYCRRAGYHRARATNSCSGIFPPRGMILSDAFADQKEIFALVGSDAEDGRLHARQRYLRHRDVERHQRPDAEIQHALHDRSRKSPTIRRRAICPSKWRRPRRAMPTRSSSSAGSTMPCCSRANWSSSAGRRRRS